MTQFVSCLRDLSISLIVQSPNIPGWSANYAPSFCHSKSKIFSVPLIYHSDCGPSPNLSLSYGYLILFYRFDINGDKLQKGWSWSVLLLKKTNSNLA